MLKKIIRELLPAIIIDFFRRPQLLESDPYRGMWSGNFGSYEIAKVQSKGYDSDVILSKVFNSVNKVKTGEFPYERDSVLFNKVEYSWALLSCLYKIASVNGGVLRVLDFGGSLGSTYFQNAKFLGESLSIQWHILEQPHFATCGKENFENSQLHFHSSFTDFSNVIADCLLWSSVLQYLPEPYTLIDNCLEKNFEYILIDRTAFLQGDSERITIQKVPEEIYEASYPAWFFNERKFLDKFESRYELIADFPSFADPDQILDDGTKAYWKGFFFKKR